MLTNIVQLVGNKYNIRCICCKEMYNIKADVTCFLC
jgi:hypothetical protein